MTTENDIQLALDIARRLITGGVPVFAAAPCPPECPGYTDKRGVHHPHHKNGPGHYHLPYQWEKTVPSTVWLDKWQPGWGLAAVGGHVCDFLDVDPRNGGRSSSLTLEMEGEWPLEFGRAVTPSGGNHLVVARTGLRKSTMFMPGLDLQSGDPAGVGRGFVWIAPTVRPSKDPADAGALKAYRWQFPPDLELLAEAAEDALDSMQPIIRRITEKRAAPAERERIEVKPRDPDDPFVSASEAGRMVHQDRSFTLTEAQDFVRPYLLELQAAKVGQIEETANRAATVISHFVPEFWDAESAFDLLTASLAETAYDPDGPSDWTAEKFRAVLDGRRPPLDPWKATRKTEPPVTPEVRVEAAPGEEALSTLEKLRRRLMSADQLAALPPPELLVEGLLDMDSETWIIGAPGSFKSFVVLDLAAHIGCGLPWQGRRVRQGNVLYLAAEGARGLTLRARAWQERHERKMDNVYFLPYPVHVQSNDGQWAALVEIARELNPVYVVIDTQHRVTTGLEENSAKDMGIFTDAVSAIRRATGACVKVVHHTGRNGKDARGSSALDGAQDTELKVERPEDKAGRDALVCRVLMDKQKDMAEESGGIELALEKWKLGQDPETGRELSSLVVMPHDAAEAVFRAASGYTKLDVDVEPWKGKQPAEWTKRAQSEAGLTTNSKLRDRILQVLADHAHDRGLTKSEALKVVAARWYDPAKGKGPDADSWTDAWNRVVSLRPLVINIAGERFGIDPVELSTLWDGQG